MDPAALAQKVTEIIAPSLPFIYAGGTAVIDKSKDILLEKGIEKLGFEGWERAKALLDKISPKMDLSLEKTLIEISRNSEDIEEREKLQQEIFKLLNENPDLLREIESKISNIEKIGQLAVGTNNIFNINTPSEYKPLKKKRKEEVTNKVILDSYNPSTLPYYSERLKQFVTKNRADELDKFSEYLKEHRTLFLSGVGGVGKSTLVRALVDRRPINVLEPFWFNFNQNQDAKLSDVLEKLASYLKAPEIAYFKVERREPKKFDVDKLTDELQRRSEVWLIFDDLSTVLEDVRLSDEETEIRFSDKGIELLFSSLRYNTHNAKIIITSRNFPRFENGESLLDITDDEKKQYLNGLRTDFAIDYLAENGLDEVEHGKLEELATGVDGHPLALNLLVELVKESGIERSLEDLSMYQKSKEKTIKKARRLFDRLAGEEIEFLEYISVYREPVKEDALKAIFTKNTVDDVIKRLREKSLLETEHGMYWLHPLVQEFAYDNLENKDEAHTLACKYYLSTCPHEEPRKKEDLRPLIEAHHHACTAGDYSLAVQIIRGSKLHDYLDNWGEYTTCKTLYKRMLQADFFRNGDPLNKKMVSFVYGNLGFTYFRLGCARKAMEYCEQAIKIDREIRDRYEEGKHLGYLGLIYRIKGEPTKSLEHIEQAVKIDKEIRDRQEEGKHLAYLGIVYHDLKEPKKAMECCEQALEIAKEMAGRGAITKSRALSYMGLAYRDLGELGKTIDYCEQALEIAKKIGGKDTEAIALSYMGLAYRDLNELNKAIECHQHALKIARELGDRRGEAIDFSNIGNAYRDLKEPSKAIEYHQQAIEIFRELGDKSGEAIDLTKIGEAYCDLEESRKAIEYHQQAIEIFRELGDKSGEAIDLTKIGEAYCDLEESRKAIECHRQALEIDKELGDRREEAIDFSNIGNAYRDLKEPSKAIEYHQQAIEIFRELGDKSGEAIDLTKIGEAYCDLGESRKAIECHRQALEIDKELGDRRGEAIDLNNIGNAYRDLGEPRKAIEYYEQALKIARELKDKSRESIYLNNIRNSYDDLEELEKLIEYDKQATKPPREIEEKLEARRDLEDFRVSYEDLEKLLTRVDYKKSKKIDQKNRERDSLKNLGNQYRDLRGLRRAIESLMKLFGVYRK